MTQEWRTTEKPCIKKRPHPEHGNRYKVRVNVQDPSGSRVQKQRTLDPEKSLEDAVEVRERLKEMISNPTPSPEERATTMASYATRWIKRKVSEGLKPRTLKGYRRVLAHRILPRIGHLELEQLTRAHVLDWIEWASSQTREDGRVYATKTVRRWWRVFRNLLRDAHADGYLERDLTRRVPRIETGRNGVRSEETLTVDELREVVEAAREETPKRAAEIVTLSYTGMRSGELWALHRDDINHERNSIHIHRSVSDGEVVDRTKTDVDRRIPMHPVVSEAIREHRKLLIRRQHDGLQSELVFPSDEGTPRYPGSLRKAFATITDAIGLDKHVSPQVLRRTFVTLMRTAQIDSIVSRSIVGHESEEMQEHYAGVSVEQKREALDSILTAEGG